MAVTYICKYCGMELGKIIDENVTEAQLGFHFLTPEERNDIITYNSDGDIIARVICDYCRDALRANPELSLLSSPLQ